VQNNRYAIFGIVGSLLPLVFIAVAIMLSPWFSWQNNALSDLGHAVKSNVAPIFNFGLFFSGFLMIIYTIKALKNYAKYTSYFLLFAFLAFQLVAIFDEVYGFLHFVVSISFFLLLGLSTMVYAVERKSILASVALVLFLIIWTLSWMGLYGKGVAIPELLSSLAAMLWFLSSAISIYLVKKS
jgi:hypothetical membrane protein